MNLWDQILARIETKMNRHAFYTWFRPTSFVTEDRASVTVRVPDSSFQDWLTKHYGVVISEAMAELTAAEPDREFRHGIAVGSAAADRARRPTRPRPSTTTSWRRRRATAG